VTAINTKIISLESRDFEEMGSALAGFDTRYQKISSGAFGGGLFSVQTGSVTIFRNRWECSLHYQGTAPAGVMGLAISLAQTGEAHWMGERVGFNDMIVQRGGSEADYFSGRYWDCVVITMPEAELANHIAHLTHGDPEVILNGQNVFHLKPQVAVQLREALIAYLHAAKTCLTRLDARSRLAEMARSSVELLVRALVDAQPPSRSKRNLDSQRRLINQAVDCYFQRPNRSLRIGQLCHETGVSERSLRDAFHKLTGMSPHAYMKTERLNRVFHVLRTSDPNETLIKKVVYANGFSHLGQFSQDYKLLFGELPSETLQRG